MKKSIEYNGRRFTGEYASLTATPNPLEFMYVTCVNHGSVAKNLGIKPGDMLLEINAVCAATADLKGLYLKNENIDYLFFRQSESKGIVIKGPSIPLGIELEQTSDRIIQLAEEFEEEDQQLQQLWQRRDWQGLLLASEFAAFKHSWLSRMVLFLGRKKYDGPGVLMEGIARYELGEKEKAMNIISYYLDNYIHSNTTEFHALCFYYVGLGAIEKEDKEQAYHYWYNSDKYCRCNILQQRLQQLGVEGPLKDSWQYRQFPVDFQLSNLDQTEHYQLSEMLAQLKPQQFLFVAGLPWYRTNTPLDRYMLEYEKLFKRLGEHCGPFVVLTDDKDASAHAKAEFEVEERLIAEGLPIRFLYDEDSIVTEQLKQSSSPFIYVLNKQGVVLNKAEITFNAHEVWGWLAYEFGDVFVDCDDNE